MRGEVFCILFVSLFAATAVLAAEPGAKGIVIYKGFMALTTDAKVAEYEAIEVYPQVVNYRPPGRKEMIRLMRSQVVEIVEFPVIGPVTSPALAAKLREDQAAWTKRKTTYPAIAPHATPVLTAIQTALNEYAAAPSAPPQAGTPVAGVEPSIRTLSGRVYTQVRIAKADAARARLTHSSGIAVVPFTDLDPVWRVKLGYDEAAAGELLEKEAEERKTRQAAAMRDVMARERYLSIFGRWEVHMHELAEELKAATTSSSDNPLTPREQNIRIDQAGKVWEEANAELAVLKDHASQMAVEGKTDEEIRRVVNSVLDRELYVGMPASLVEIAWGQPDEKSGRSILGKSVQVWGYRRENLAWRTVTLIDGAVTEFTTLTGLE